MSAKPIKPRRMWTDALPGRGTYVPCHYQRGVIFCHPVLVIDLSPESVEALEKKLTAVLWDLGAVDRSENEHIPAQAALSALGIRPTKGRK